MRKAHRSTKRTDSTHRREKNSLIFATRTTNISSSITDYLLPDRARLSVASSTIEAFLFSCLVNLPPEILMQLIDLATSSHLINDSVGFFPPPLRAQRIACDDFLICEIACFPKVFNHVFIEVVSPMLKRVGVHGVVFAKATCGIVVLSN